MRVLLLLLVCLVGCRSAAPEPTTVADLPPDEAIRAVLDAQVVAWNDGSVRGFMEGYAQTDSLRFASRGTVRTGWHETLAGYERGYPDAATMGTLTFSDLDVRLLSPDWAIVFGRWRLDRAADAPNGLFTLTMQRRPEGWRVLYDHTSSAE
ncbi:MAG: nuclear transport factor 2 family protein [Bacteroidota bacterium]